MKNSKNSLYFYANPANAYRFYCTYQDADYKKLYSDGIFIPIILKFFGKSVERISPDLSSLAKTVLNDAIDKNYKVLFIGGTPDNISSFRSNLSSLFPKLLFSNIDGYQSDYKVYKNYVKNYNPNIIFVGLGFPLQERLLLYLSKFHSPFAGYSCGAFISQTAHSKMYYPYIINKLNMRWFYRAILCKHVRKRLLVEYPKFFFKFLTDSRFRTFIIESF